MPLATAGSRPRVSAISSTTPARLPLAEAGRALAAAGGEHPRDRDDRPVARSSSPSSSRRSSRGLELVGSILLACVLAVVAYAGVFVAVGLWLRRALWWCLLYILVWENGLARAVDGAARLSIASYAQSLVAAKADVVVSYADRGTGASIVAPIVAAIAGLVLAVIRYRRAEID